MEIQTFTIHKMGKKIKKQADIQIPTCSLSFISPNQESSHGLTY